MAAPLKHYVPTARRQLGQMDLLASPSRSGGHAADEDALLSYAVQEQFREHIQAKLDGLRTRFGLVLDDSWGKILSIDDEREAYYAAVDMLLLLRKLREGIVASKRRDAFAVKVYETAARLALKTASLPHLISSLSALVRDLYPNVARSSSADDALLSGLAELSVRDRPKPKAAYLPPHLRGAAVAEVPIADPTPTSSPSRADERDLFVSVFLILQLSHFQSPSSFVEVISEVTGSSSALCGTAAPADHRRWTAPRKGKEIGRSFLSADALALVVPRQIYRAHVTFNYVALLRLLSPNPPSPIHPLERLALRYGLPKQREAAWRTARASYRDVGPADLAWLGTDVLGFQGAPGQGKAERWLEEKGCVKGPNGRWLLKTGRE